jgi:hypothetical protein
LPAAVRLAGLEIMVRQGPPVSVVEVLRQQVDELLDQAGVQLAEAPISIRVRALLAASLDPPEIALSAVEDWINVDADDADAYVCRFGCHLRAGEWDLAIFDATLAQVNAAEPADVRWQLRRRLERLDDQGEEVPDDVRERIYDVLQAGR